MVKWEQVVTPLQMVVGASPGPEANRDRLRLLLDPLPQGEVSSK